MPRSGAGTYALPAPPSPFVNGQTASATDVMTVLNDIAAALTASVAADGQTPLTGTLNANGNSITAVGAIGAASLVTTAAILAGTGVTVTKGGVTVNAGGITVAGNSAITGTLTTNGALTVSTGGAGITGNTTIVGALSTSDAITVSKGGAAITGDSTVTGTLTVSSTINAAAATKAGQVVIYDQFPVTAAVPGTMALPNGIILKWGTGTYAAGVGTVTFAANFPNALLSVQCTLLTSGAAHGSYPPGPTASTYAVSGFTVYGGTGQSGSFSWLAIGH